MKPRFRPSRRLLLGLIAPTLLLPLATLAADAPKPSNKWRIECDGGARSAGEVSFRVTPLGGAPVEVSIKVPANHGENAIAHDLRDAFRAKLPRKQFHVEVDDGEDVLVKRRAGNPEFVLELVSSTVEHTRFTLQRE